MIRPLAASLIAFACAWGLPAITVAQDVEQFVAEPLTLDVRMTAPSGGFWETPVRWVPNVRPAVLPALYVSLIGLQVYDGYSTTRGLSNGAIESNTFMRYLAAKPVALWAVKGAVTFGSIYTAERLWRKNRRGQAIAVMAVTNGLMAAVALTNASVLREQK